MIFTHPEIDRNNNYSNFLFNWITDLCIKIEVKKQDNLGFKMKLFLDRGNFN